MGFAKDWVRLIMMCVTTVKYQVVYEDDLLGPIIPQRGLRQGDPLSPYLFILCAEGLSTLLRDKEQRGKIHGCKVASKAVPLTHLFFADDCYLFCRANTEEADEIKQVLQMYEKASG